MRLGWCVIALLAACSHVASVEPGVCGNDVLEPGEDCDRPGSACTADCRITCDPTAATTCASATAIDGTCCPGGYACGLDRECHAPSGELASATAQEVPVSSYQLGDFDGDGRDDLIGLGTTDVVLRYGAADAPLAAGDDLVAPLSTASGSIGDITGDRQADIVLPFSSGMVAYETTTGALQPVLFPEARLATADGDAFVAAAQVAPGALARLDQMSGQLELSQDGQSPAPPCGLVADATMLRTHALHPFDDAGHARVPLMFSIPCNTGGSCPALHGIRVCVSTPDGTVAQQFSTSVVGTTNIGDVLLADLDADPTTCPDLIAGAESKPGDAATTYVVPHAASSTPGACTLDPTIELDARSFDDGASASRSIGVALGAIALATSPATTGVITPNGIFAVTPAPIVSSTATGGGGDQLVDSKQNFVTAGIARGDLVVTHTGTGQHQVAAVLSVVSATTLMLEPLATQLDGTTKYTIHAPARQLLPSTRAWGAVAVGDIDGDGLADFAATGATGDVEVFRQLPAVAGVPQFRQVRIPTSEAVSQVALGDYDGDGLLDVAIDATDGAGDDELSVAFAIAPGVFAPPSVVADLPTPTFMTTSDLPSPLVPPAFDHAEGLAVGDGTAMTSTAPASSAELIDLFGSGTRQLAAPWVDATAAGASLTLVDPVQFSAASGVLGVYAQDGTDTMKFLAYDGETFVPQAAQPVPADFTQLTKSVVWRRASGDIALYVTSKSATEPATCLAYVRGPDDTVATNGESCEQLVPAGTPTDFLYAVSGMHVITRPGTPRTDDPTLLWTSKYVPACANTATTVARGQLWTLSLTADGVPQLAPAADLEGELQAALGPATCPASTTAKCGTACRPECGDVWSAELGTRTVDGTIYGANRLELVMACQVGDSEKLIARYAADDGAAHYEVLQDFGTTDHHSLHVGDVNGDGLDDLVTGLAHAGDVDLSIALQCDTHDPACTGGP